MNSLAEYSEKMNAEMTTKNQEIQEQITELLKSANVTPLQSPNAKPKPKKK